EKSIPVNISLQYIDAFSNNLMQGLTAYQFIQEKLGLKVSKPEIIESMMVPNANRGLSLQFNAELEGGFILVMSVSEGMANNQSAVLVHTNIRTSNAIA